MVLYVELAISHPTHRTIAARGYTAFAPQPIAIGVPVLVPWDGVHKNNGPMFMLFFEGYFTFISHAVVRRSKLKFHVTGMFMHGTRAPVSMHLLNHQ